MLQHKSDNAEPFKENVTEFQAMQLSMFRATHQFHQLDECLSRAFSGYLESDVLECDEPRERQDVYDSIRDLQQLLRVLLPAT